VLLFRRFFVMKATSQHTALIGGYYFQRRTQGRGHYIAPISPGRWEHWRDDWALVQADIYDRLTLPVAALTLDCIEWVKDPGLESGFDPVLDRIKYLTENCLTSLMVLHDFLSKHLTPLRTGPAWMYTRVNDIMRLDRGPGSSLDEVLLATSLKALTTDQFSAKLMVPPVAGEPICVNQVVRTALLAAMRTLDDVNIAPVQRGDQSRGVVIPRAGGLVSVASGHGRGSGTEGGGGVPAGGGRGGVPAGDRGGMSSLTTMRYHPMRYHPMRMSLYRNGRNRLRVPVGRASLPLLCPMWQPR
jgi:hypothetical protein